MRKSEKAIHRDFDLQMLLPEGFERKDDKKYQEVHIPPSDPPPTHVGRNLVSISQLDEVRNTGLCCFSALS